MLQTTLKKIDLCIIGAGPAGTVAASIAASHGLSVLIVERQSFPRFVIGESLLPSSMAHFEQAGFLPALLARGYVKKRGALFIKNDRQTFFDFSQQFSRVTWTWTWQVERADFDHTLAREVQKRGVEILWNTSVEAVDMQAANGPMLKTVSESGEPISVQCRFVIDASGYGRVLPRLLHLDRPSSFPRRVSLFTHVHDPRKPHGSAGDQITFHVPQQDLWFWIIPLRNNCTSIGFVGDPHYFDPAMPPELLLQKLIAENPVLNQRFGQSPFLLPVGMLKSYSCSVTKLHGQGFALAGNATEFLDPVFSSGVAFATESGALAARLCARQLAGEMVDWQTQYEQHMRKGIGVFSEYVHAWYDGTLQDIFFSDNASQDIKNKITSVLSGYVWDETNPFVKKPRRALNTLAKVINEEFS